MKTIKGPGLFLAQFAGEAVGSEAPVRRRTSAPGVANFAQLG